MHLTGNADTGIDLQHVLCMYELASMGRVANEKECRIANMIGCQYIISTRDF